MSASYTLFNEIFLVITVLGLTLNHRNILRVLLSIELIYLIINVNFLHLSNLFDDIFGQLFSLFILTIAACESAIGIAIVILFYRQNGNLSLSDKYIIRY